MTLDPSARERVAASQAYADEVASPARSTAARPGSGANRELVLPEPDSQAQQLLRSHATSSASGARRPGCAPCS